MRTERIFRRGLRPVRGVVSLSAEILVLPGDLCPKSPNGGFCLALRRCSRRGSCDFL